MAVPRMQPDSRGLKIENYRHPQPQRYFRPLLSRLSPLRSHPSADTSQALTNWHEILSPECLFPAQTHQASPKSRKFRVHCNVGVSHAYFREFFSDWPMKLCENPHPFPRITPRRIENAENLGFELGSSKSDHFSLFVFNDLSGNHALGLRKIESVPYLGVDLAQSR